MAVHDKHRCSMLKNHLGFDQAGCSFRKTLSRTKETFDRLQIKAFLSITCSSTNITTFFSEELKHRNSNTALPTLFCWRGNFPHPKRHTVHTVCYFCALGHLRLNLKSVCPENQRPKNQNTRALPCVLCQLAFTYSE